MADVKLIALAEWNVTWKQIKSDALILIFVPNN